AMKSCLDVIGGRIPALAEDSTLKQNRAEVDRNSSVFVYVAEKGIQTLVELSPALLDGRSGEPERVCLFVDLIEHLSWQTGAALPYALQFERGGVTERYLTALHPQIAEALAVPLKSSPAASFESLPLIPPSVERLTLLNTERAGELPERVLKHLSPTIDVVAG